MNIRSMINTDIRFDASFFINKVERNYTDIPKLSNPYWFLYWISEGHFDCTIRNHEFRLKPNQFMLIPPFVPFRPLHLEKSLCLCMHFFCTLKPKDPQKNYFLVPSNDEDKKQIDKLFHIHMNTNINNLDSFRPNIKQSLLDRILVQQIFYRLDSHELVPNEELSVFFDLAFELLVHPEKEIPIKEMAQRMNMPITSFKSFVKHTVGMPPRLFFNHIRLSKSWNWLSRTDMELDEIAEKLGFSDRYSFSHLFKKVYHTTPAKVRKAHENEGWQKKDLPVIPY